MFSQRVAPMLTKNNAGGNLLKNKKVMPPINE